jgi:hypothetical protein
MMQLGLFGGKPKTRTRNGRRKGARVPKMGMGSCVWALVDPTSTRKPGDPGYDAGKKWRRAKVHAYGRPFKGVWVRLARTIGGQDVEAAERISWHASRPRSMSSGVTAKDWIKKAGPMGKYQLETCRR